MKKLRLIILMVGVLSAPAGAHALQFCHLNNFGQLMGCYATLSFCQQRAVEFGGFCVMQ